MTDEIKAKRKKLSDYIIDPNNPNAGSIRGTGMLETSVGEFGPARSGVVDSSGVIRAGNHTAEQLMAAGIEEVIEIETTGKEWVVVKRPDWSKKQAKKYSVVDNRTGEFIDWSPQILDQMMKEDIDLSDYFDSDELGAIMSTLPIEAPVDPGPQTERADELLEKWKCKLGDLYLVASQSGDGEHRLLCGDSTSDADVQRLMDSKRAVLFATDPPYLVDYDGTNHRDKWNEPDKNKDLSDSYHDWDDAAQGQELYDGFIEQAIAHAITEDAAWYCWHASCNQAMLEKVWENHGAFVHQQIIWMKDRPILTRSWYMWQHEPCFFGWRRPHKPTRSAEDYLPSVWVFPTLPAGEKSVHPTSKPVELFSIPILQHCHRGDVVYEPFAGSGSQLVAAEQNGVLCYAMELQPQYVAVILERLEMMGLAIQVPDR